MLIFALAGLPLPGFPQASPSNLLPLPAERRTWARATQLQGSEVVTVQSELLGTLRELVFNFPGGEAVLAQVETDTGQSFPVPLAAFFQPIEPRRLVLTRDRESLEAQRWEFSLAPPTRSSSAWERLDQLYRDYGLKAPALNTNTPLQFRTLDSLAGEPVRSGATQEVAVVRDLLVDLRAGRVMHYLLEQTANGESARGGLVPIPPAILTGSGSTGIFWMGQRSTIEEGPRLGNGEEEKVDRAWLAGIYRVHGAEPWWPEKAPASAERIGTAGSISREGAGAAATTAPARPGDSWDRPDNREVVQKIRRKIQEDPQLGLIHPDQFQLEASKREIFLKGVLPREIDRNRLVRLVSESADSRNVRSEIEIQPSPKATP